MLLEVKHLTKRFGGLIAVDDLDMSVDEGELVGLIGPNGAGKTTVFNLITGIHTPTRGTITFAGRDTTRIRPHEAAALGIGRTFQLAPCFADFTVEENVSIAFHLHPRSRVSDMYLNTKKYRNNETYIANKTIDILRLVGLDGVGSESAKNQPHGYQKMLGVARALATQPRLLLLDEPLGGMNPSEIEFCLNVIARLRDEGIAILVVEHNMQILDLCDRVVVTNFGRKICEGSPSEVRENKEVISAYFGGEGAA